MPEGNEAADLVHDAVRLVLDGDRTWPPDVPLEMLLTGIVRSLASHLAEGSANTHDDYTAEIADAQMARDPDQLPARTPEQNVVEKEACEAIASEAMAAAGDDQILGKIVEAALDGHVKADEIASAAGLTPAQVYEGNRRLRRRLDAVAAQRRRS